MLSLWGWVEVRDRGQSGRVVMNLLTTRWVSWDLQPGNKEYLRNPKFLMIDITEMNGMMNWVLSLRLWRRWEGGIFPGPWGPLFTPDNGDLETREIMIPPDSYQWRHRGQRSGSRADWQYNDNKAASLCSKSTFYCRQKYSNSNLFSSMNKSKINFTI